MHRPLPVSETMGAGLPFRYASPSIALISRGVGLSVQYRWDECLGCGIKLANVTPNSSWRETNFDLSSRSLPGPCHDRLYCWRFPTMISSRTILSCALVGSFLLNSGCASFWHDLKPSRLHRLNRGAAPSLDPEFSRREHRSSTQLAKRQSPTKKPTISANSAEIAMVRAQSPY